MLDSPEFIAPAMTTNELKDQEVKLAENKTPSVFKVRAQMLEQGRTDTMLAATDNLTVRLKVYASGGENELHTHTQEDHSMELGKHQGIMLPGGAFYKFFATSDEPLVLLRIGNPNVKKQTPPYRVNIKGEEMKGDSKENKKVPVIFKDGAFFG